MQMSYTDYLLWKFGALCLAAFVWGLYTGSKGLDLSGQPKQQGQNGTKAAPPQD